VIYASLSAYGSSGPDCGKPGYDAILQARTGIVSVTGPNRDTPIRAGVSILDMGAGVWMALGILAALFERQSSGRGQRVEASLFQTGVMLMCYHLLYRQFSGVNPGPQGSRHASVAPYGAFSTTDGRGDDWHFQRSSFSAAVHRRGPRGMGGRSQLFDEY